MSRWMTARRARVALAICLVAVPAWHAISPNALPTDRAAADQLMRSATRLFAPSELTANHQTPGRAVPLGLRN